MFEHSPQVKQVSCYPCYPPECIALNWQTFQILFLPPTSFCYHLSFCALVMEKDEWILRFLLTALRPVVILKSHGSEFPSAGSAVVNGVSHECHPWGWQFSSSKECSCWGRSALQRQRGNSEVVWGQLHGGLWRFGLRFWIWPGILWGGSVMSEQCALGGLHC